MSVPDLDKGPFEEEWWLDKDNKYTTTKVKST